MKLFCIFLAVLPLSLGAMDLNSVSCKDEKGNNVDWFINYKAPRLVGFENLSFTGKEYGYLVSGHPTDEWIRSHILITEENSMLARTMGSFYNTSALKGRMTYIIYNDKVPTSYPEIRISRTVGEEFAGHTKGVVMFDLNQGFWLIHSIPKFPHVSRYIYPQDAIPLAQCIFCMTFGIHQLNVIGKQLLLNHPLIYSHHLNPDLKVHLDDDVKSLFTNNPKFIKGHPAHGKVILKTKYKNIIVTSFAKNAEFHKDLYSDLIAPDLGTPLFVQTWRQTPAVPLPPACSHFDVLDVTTVGAVGGWFPSNQDHSKWAVSQNEIPPFVCIGDTDRVLSDTMRGGGAACIGLTEVWKIFRNGAKQTDSCPKVDIKQEL